MTAHADLPSAQLPCHRCGYDLRVHPPDGACPECGGSVAESRRVAAVPVRPAWRDSDPRWRRRMLSGAWVLVLLPLMDALKVSGWAARVPVPTVLFGSHDPVRTLHHSLAGYPNVYQPLVFCVGVVLLFSRERGRRRGRLDWTRRWGVLCSYVVLLLSAANFFFLLALVLTGIGALLQSMPLKYQPPATQTLVKLSGGYLRYGPHPMEAAGLVLTATASITVLLACVPLFDALRGSGPKRVAVVPLAPLALLALVHLGQVARYCLAPPSAGLGEVFSYGVYFRPEQLVSLVADPMNPLGSSTGPAAVWVEGTKWWAVLAIAVWLTVAQLAAWRRRTGRRIVGRSDSVTEVTASQTGRGRPVS